MIPRRVIKLSVSIVFLLIAARPAQSQTSFTVIPSEAGTFEAVSASDLGAVIGGRLNGGGALWSATGGFEVIGGSYFRGLSGDGNSACVSTNCLWVRNQGCVPGIYATDCWGISRNGKVVFGYKDYDSSGCSTSTVRFSRDTGVTSELCAGRCTYPAGCSDDGSIVVGKTGDCSGAWQAYKWTVGGGQTFICRGWASDVDGTGKVVVGRCNEVSPPRAFRHEAFQYGGSRLVYLEPLPGYEYSEASRVTSDGTLVLGYSLSSAGFRSTLWVNGQVIDFFASLAQRGVNLAGWSNLEARGVSRDGKAIVGTGTFEGSMRSWVVTGYEPTISGVIPASGPAVGGTVVTISGFNFPQNPAVIFGTVPATSVNFVSPNKLVVTTPENLPGNCAITVDWITTTDAFYYRPECGSDLDQDGEVTAADIAIVLLDFGPCYSNAANTQPDDSTPFLLQEQPAAAQPQQR